MGIDDKKLFERVKDFNTKFPQYAIKDLSKLTNETAKEALRIGILNAQKFMSEETAKLSADVSATDVAGGSGVKDGAEGAEAEEEDLDGLMQGTVDGKGTKKGAKFKQSGTLRVVDPATLVANAEDVKVTDISNFKTAEDVHKSIVGMDAAAGETKKAAAKLVLQGHLLKAKDAEEAAKKVLVVKQLASQARLDALRVAEAAALEAKKTSK
jgi:hypothetical protein